MGGAAASLADSAVADEDAGLLPAALTSAGKPPPRQPNHRKVLRADVSCVGRRARASLPDQSAQPEEQAENGAEPPHAPSPPAAVERVEPPGRQIPHRFLLLPFNLLFLRGVHGWRKHSVMVCKI
ncbi:hypothetical protein ILYODFUR_038246 [Ilyodon furcidens]|uniref:Uncharacterized protein n=1 Tax=Ilyodon furcidens TaxID=33524 RepID=A0ABV0VC12_9TELE